MEYLSFTFKVLGFVNFEIVIFKIYVTLQG